MANKATIDGDTLRSQAIKYIQKLIMSGKYKPGDRVVESQLALELNMSQAPVREAILELSVLGVLERRPYSGSFVRELDIKEIASYYDARAYIEKYAAQLAASNRNSDDLKAMRYALFEMDECNDRLQFTDYDHHFHEIILDASGNKALKRAWSSLSTYVQTLRSTLVTEKTLDELRESHREIYRYIESGNAEAAGKSIYQHIKGFGDEFTLQYSTSSNDNRSE